MADVNAELLASLKECYVAICAAMRVVADLDMAHTLGMDRDTRAERFVDELHGSGVQDGFGERAKAAIAKAEAKR